MIEPVIVGEATAYSCPWFDLVAKRVRYDGPSDERVFLGIRGPDCVCVVAVTEDGTIPLVRQYRPVVGRVTLELPSGHVEADERPEDAARRELREETGFAADELVPLGRLIADSGRLEYSQWCYFAPRVRRTPAAGAQEDGIDVVLCPADGFADLVRRGDFAHAPHLAAWTLAMLQKRIES